MSAEEEKKGGDGKTVLILGGTGFIGRNLVKYLVDNNLASKIRVVDKSMPLTSYMSKAHKAAFDQKDIVEFKQCDLAKEAHIKRAFGDMHFDYVINLCGETRFGLTEQDYKTKVQQTAENAVAAALEHKVERFVEVSSAQIYAPDKHSSKEDAKLKPWTLQAKYRLIAEEAVKKAEGLPWVVLRPAYVYGEGDLTSITPRVLCAVAYKIKKEKMRLLWDKSLQVNVVHVNDVVEAIWLACTTIKEKSIYNLADSTNLNQGMLNAYLGKIFGIKTGFLGKIVSNMAKLNLSAVALDANDKHVGPWTRLCQEYGILNTPLSAYIDKELLYFNHLSIDGTKITQETEFKYKVQCSEEAIRQQIDLFMEQGIFPPILGEYAEKYEADKKNEEKTEKKEKR